MLRKSGVGAMALLSLVLLAAPEAGAQARITSSTMDADGNVYVTGWRGFDVRVQYDVVTIKYDRDGIVMWAHAYASPVAGGNAEGYGIAVDPSGNAYVAGFVRGAVGADCLLIKYPAGYAQGQDPEWVRTYDGGVGPDQNWTLAIDSDGHIYLTGYSLQDHDGGVSYDIITIKYDGEGNMAWGAPRFHTPPAGDSDAFAIAVDPVRKNVYVTGTSLQASYDMITIMYDEQGTEQWVRTYDGPAGGIDRGNSLVLDPDGNAYVTGWSQGTTLASDLDYATIKYDLAGNQLWVARYNGPAGNSDQPAPPTGYGAGGAFFNYVNSNQGILVTEEILDAVPAIEYLMEEVSRLDVNRGIANSLYVKLDAALSALLADKADLRQNAQHPIAAFVNHVQSLSEEGVLTGEDASWLISVARQIIQAILGIETRVVYVTGHSAGVGTNVDFATIKYNAADGSPMWRLRGQPGTTVGAAGTPADIALRHNGPLNSIDRAWGMAMDFDGNIFVTGPSTQVSGQRVDYFTVKYFVTTYEPAVLAEASYNGPGNGPDQSCGFATWRDPATGRHFIFRDSASGEDYVAVTGSSTGLENYNEYATVMYDGALVQRWLQRYY